eukprot:10307938-Alexandrium_andersonii.AAC.1
MTVSSHPTASLSDLPKPRAVRLQRSGQQLRPLQQPGAQPHSDAERPGTEGLVDQRPNARPSGRWG